MSSTPPQRRCDPGGPNRRIRSPGRGFEGPSHVAAVVLLLAACGASRTIADGGAVTADGGASTADGGASTADGGEVDAGVADGGIPCPPFQVVRIRQIQEPTGARDSSPLLGQDVTIEGGNLVVVDVGPTGFFATDRDESTYRSLRVSTSAAPLGLRRGDRLLRICGTVMEFLGDTHLSALSFEVNRRCPRSGEPERLCGSAQFCVGEACLPQHCAATSCAEGALCEGPACAANPNIPEPTLNPNVGTSREMEPHEGGLVRLTDVLMSREYKNCDDPAQNPGANGNGTSEFCRTCTADRDAAGACPSGGRCCPLPQLCAQGECANPCTTERDANGACPTGATCCEVGNQCSLSLLRCNGCTRAEKAEAACESECAARGPGSPGGLCTSASDWVQFGRYRVGLTTSGQWTGVSLFVASGNSVPSFRPESLENRGRLLRAITGTLRNIYAPTALWIVNPRDECDIEGIPRQRTDCANVR